MLGQAAMTVQSAISPSATLFAIPASHWDDSEAAGMTPAELLLYRSNLLGGDLTVTNFGGGNTSAKLVETDPLTGESVEVLWVKGSGGDLGSMALDGFATLYQDKLLGLERHYAGPDDDDTMAGYLPHCTFGLNPRAASIDTPLHSLLPFAHVDHVHPDAVIALAASSGGEAATRAIWGGRIGWLAWKRPGYMLGAQLRDYVAANPGLEGVMLAGHGIICWAGSAKACYEHTIALIADAARYLNDKLADRPAFGGQVVAPHPDREAIAAGPDAAPQGTDGAVTGARSGICPTMPRRWNSPARPTSRRSRGAGTSCPDHFLRTKIKPLTLDPARLGDEAYLARSIADFRAAIRGLLRALQAAQFAAMRDANPVVVLVPGVGRITFAADKTTARLAGEFYGNAIASCAGPRRSAATSRSTNKRPSTSNTGCSKRPSCNACPSPNRSRAASR